MKRIFSALLILCMLVCLIPMQAMADEFDDYFGNGDDNVLYVMLAVMTEDNEPVGEGYYTIMESAGANVDLMDYIPAGYKIVRVVVEGDTSSFAVDSNWCFTMPDAPGELLCYVAPDNGSGNGGSNPGGNNPGGGNTNDTEYTVTLGEHSNGNVIISPTSATAGTTIHLTPMPSDGYALNKFEFSVSSVSAQKTDDSYTFEMPASNVTVNAYFVPTITVTLYYNDASNKVTSVQVPQGGTVELPTPTWEGHRFLGWYTAKNEQVSASTKFTEGTNIYAHWATVAHTTDTDSNAFGAGIALSDEEVLNRFVSEEELASGKNITVRLVVNPLTESSVPSADASAIVAMAGEDVVSTYLDIKLLKKIGNDPEFTITDTAPNTVPITMTVDAGLIPADATKVYIIYYHEGAAATLNATYNASTRALSFNASEFSTYALAYSTTENGAGGNGGNGSHGGNGGHGSHGGNGTGGTLDNVPKTGDAALLGGWSLMALCCTAALACVCIYDKKRAR